MSRLLYRDGLMLIVDKPAGVAVHKGPKGGPCLEDDFGALRFGLPRSPALAHRLDRETSGCLVLGRHRKALAHLSDLFRHGRVGKTYWAVVEGGPTEQEGRIDLPLGKLDDNRGWWMKPDPKGLPSSTTWRVLGQTILTPNGTPNALHDGAASVPSPLVGEGKGGLRPPFFSGRTPMRSIGCGGGSAARIESSNHPPPQPSPTRGEGAHRTSGTNSGSHVRQLTWLALEPLTGRTHQLRVHCAAMGWPIVGDDIYGTQASSRRLRKESLPRSGGPGLQLHAREVTVPLYKNREPVRATAPVPPHMVERLKACGWNGDDVAVAAAPALVSRTSDGKRSEPARRSGTPV